MRTRDAADCCAQDATGLADAILSEIADLLEQFALAGSEASIDLGGLPMTDADRAALAEKLGRGEVEARLDVAGRSEVWETGYAGVWWVRHLGADGRVVSEEIAITHVPAILLTHRDDARAAARRLRTDCARAAKPATDPSTAEKDGIHA